ncbi:MAG TPA: sugar phosphate nucleotidyltransferase [Jatrophihabitans sp.]|nr:sugar phosphate nucleotidyltransferase [Jatrophihabitans sp.]
MRGVRAALLAGGRGERLGRLTESVCKPLVPYGGSCRLVDFSVANTARSGIAELVLLSQHRQAALIDHLLEHWDDRAGFRLHYGLNEDLVRQRRAPGGRLPAGLPLRVREAERGTADALITNAEAVFADGARDLLLLHADHVYTFDYAPMVEQHLRSGADATIGVQAIERRYVRLFGMVEVGPGNEVRRLVEKPAEPTSELIFTAFGLFRLDVLADVLGRLAARGPAGWQHDVSRDVLPYLIESGYRVEAYPVTGYWADIGTVERYHAGHLALLAEPGLLDAGARPRTLPGPAPVTGPDADVRDSMLYPGCRVGAGARLERCVVLPGAVIEPGVRLSDTVVLGGERVAGSRSGLAAVELPPSLPEPVG